MAIDHVRNFVVLSNQFRYSNDQLCKTRPISILAATQSPLDLPIVHIASCCDERTAIATGPAKGPTFHIFAIDRSSVTQEVYALYSKIGRILRNPLGNLMMAVFTNACEMLIEFQQCPGRLCKSKIATGAHDLVFVGPRRCQPLVKPCRKSAREDSVARGLSLETLSYTIRCSS